MTGEDVNGDGGCWSGWPPGNHEARDLRLDC
jgi:hypothetical protein